MTKMRVKALLAAILLFGINISAQTTVTNYTPNVSTEGIVYYLPKTAINVNITVEKISYIPGELCQYADRYLRISNISDREDLHYTLKDVTLESAGIPDPSKVFHIKFATNSVAPLISLDDAGILMAVNTTTDSIKKAPSHSSSAKENKAINARAFMTEEMLMTGSKAKLAELAAKEIYTIRESRNLFIRGQNDNMPQDGEALQIVLDGLKEQEEALLQLFTGITKTELITKTFQVIPDTCVERIVIARLSRKLGILHPEDLAGSPIYIDINSKNNIPALVMSETKSKKKLSSKNNKSDKQEGLVYNLPEETDIKVYTNSEVLATATLPIAQFGKTETLSSNFFSKKKNIKVTLDSTTGAIKRIED